MGRGGSMEEKPWRESIEFGSRADSRILPIRRNLAGSCGDLLIRRNLADYVSSADSKCLLREGLMMIAGFLRVIYQMECSSLFRASRGAGRGISNESVV